jgi:hypothetical protein
MLQEQMAGIECDIKTASVGIANAAANWQ